MHGNQAGAGQLILSPFFHRPSVIQIYLPLQLAVILHPAHRSGRDAQAGGGAAQAQGAGCPLHLFRQGRSCGRGELANLVDEGEPHSDAMPASLHATLTCFSEACSGSAAPIFGACVRACYEQGMWLRLKAGQRV